MKVAESRNWQQQCVAVIPCLNEQEAIGDVVARVRHFLPAVVVVDDGSADRTGQIAKVAGATVLRHETTAGKGAALRTGWQHARGKGAAWSLNLDGDGQHSPDDIPQFLECADRTAAALVAGNRMTNTTGMPWLRRQVNVWMSRRLSILAGHSMPDTQCGFRLMNLASWSELHPAANHFEIESEIMLAFARAGHRVEFVPVRTIYKVEQSKILPLKDTVRWFKWWMKARRQLQSGLVGRGLPRLEENSRAEIK